MGFNAFINGQQFAIKGNPLGTPTFVFSAQTDASTSAYVLVDRAPFAFRVLGVSGRMTGAGGAGDTLAVTDGTNAITDTVDVSALSDQDGFSVQTVDDAYWDIPKGGKLQLNTASGALAFVTVECMRI